MGFLKYSMIPITTSCKTRFWGAFLLSLMMLSGPLSLPPPPVFWAHWFTCPAFPSVTWASCSWRTFPWEKVLHVCFHFADFLWCVGLEPSEKGTSPANMATVIDSSVPWMVDPKFQDEWATTGRSCWESVLTIPYQSLPQKYQPLLDLPLCTAFKTR